jgi:hypothetical protein
MIELFLKITWAFQKTKCLLLWALVLKPPNTKNTNKTRKFEDQC